MRLKQKKTGPTPRMRASQQVTDKSFDKKFAYRAKRNDDDHNTGRNNQVEQSIAKRSGGRPWYQKLGLLVLMIAVVASVVNILSLSDQPKIVSINSENSSSFLSDISEYEVAAKEIMASSLLNRSKVTVDTNSISQQLSDKYPELASVSITLPLFEQKPIIYIEPAKPVLIITTVNGTFVISDKGKAILKVENNASLSTYKLPVITDESGVRLEVGKEAISPAHVAFVDTVLKQLENRKYAVSSLKFPPASSELDVGIAGQPFTIKFNLQNNTARQQAGTFIATMDYIQKKNLPLPSKYVDVRVNGRAYYQ